MAPTNCSRPTTRKTKQTPGSTLDGASRPPRLKPSRTNPQDTTETRGGVEVQAPVAQDAETQNANNTDAAGKDTTEIWHAYHTTVAYADADNAEHAVSKAAGQPETLPCSHNVDAVQQQVQEQGKEKATTNFSLTDSPVPSSEHQQRESRDDEYRVFVAERLPSVSATRLRSSQSHHCPLFGVFLAPLAPPSTPKHPRGPSAAQRPDALDDALNDATRPSQAWTRLVSRSAYLSHIP
ncbi:hypothetical protein B0J13DRAFT_55290 [Dactylonectria estremocensis]|uniref:Uncharacterized protein n=1 Tax=Dactylonectria estremocensis TaxID=1079267 RepID=A0A9P9J2V7_9HYPO|nr:hypothetical protein B0J13DRAFT_55290 [Dactylonectria estremocensis]